MRSFATAFSGTSARLAVGAAAFLAMLSGCGPSPTPQPTSTPAVKTKPTPPPQMEVKKAEVGVGKAGHGYGDDAVTVPAATYFRVQERVAFEVLIPKAMQLFKASEGRAPKDHEEFMEKIIKANMIKLPELPEGESYWYDAKTEELMVKRPR